MTETKSYVAIVDHKLQQMKARTVRTVLFISLFQLQWDYDHFSRQDDRFHDRPFAQPCTCHRQPLIFQYGYH